MNYQAMKRQEENCNAYCIEKKPIWKVYIPCESKYMTFCKR